MSITTEHLALAYEDHVVVGDLEMRIPQGRITAIIGPNGCGKSTVLKALGRILRPKSGFVYLDGADIRNVPTREVARKMAILPQSPQAPAGLTVGELVSYGRFPHKNGYRNGSRSGFGTLKAEEKRIVAWALEVTKLAEYETVAVDNLSGGQRQRVWIAMALAQETDLILLDEPTTYLDLSYQLEILELLFRLNREQGRTILMVLHDLNLAARFADYMIALRGGAIICHGPPEAVIRPDVLRDTFGIAAEVVTEPHTKRPVCVFYDLIREKGTGDRD